MCVICGVKGRLVCTLAHLWRSENNFVDLVLSINLYTGLRDPTQMVRLQGKHSTC